MPPYASRYSQFPRHVPTIPEDVSVSSDSCHSDNMHDDLDCVSGSYGSVASGDPVHPCADTGTQAMQGGSLVYVPPDSNGPMVTKASNDVGGSSVCCGSAFGILTACWAYSFQPRAAYQHELNVDSSIEEGSSPRW